MDFISVGKYVNLHLELNIENFLSLLHNFDIEAKNEYLK